jgi:hypothetical protein
MASAVTTVKLFANAAILSYDHDPGATSAVITSPDGGTTKRVVAMENYGGFAVTSMTSVSASSSGVTKLEIVGCTDSSGSNPTVIVDSGTVAADAVGDFVAVECTAEQVKEVGDAGGLTLTHIAGRLTCSNSGDEAVVTYIRHTPRYPQSGLTANAIS